MGLVYAPLMVLGYKRGWGETTSTSTAHITTANPKSTHLLPDLLSTPLLERPSTSCKHSHHIRRQQERFATLFGPILGNTAFLIGQLVFGFSCMAFSIYQGVEKVVSLWDTTAS
ncbi:unnamed protein product [Amoebophrya sp. A25]|nr:unnamed protein product [Amoebophrya sp. A25]|eukprot:GSA25T00001292001.1